MSPLIRPGGGGIKSYQLKLQERSNQSSKLETTNKDERKWEKQRKWESSVHITDYGIWSSKECERSYATNPKTQFSSNLEINRLSKHKRRTKKARFVDSCEAKKQLDMSSVVMESLKESVCDLRPKIGTIPTKKKKELRNTLQSALRNVKEYHTFGSAIANSLHVRRRTDCKSGQWWRQKERKTRKYKIADKTRKKLVTSFCL